MVEWAVADDAIRVYGREGSTTIDAPAFEPGAPQCPLPVRVDTAVAGTTRRLTLPTDAVTIGEDAPDRRRPRLPPGDHWVRASLPIDTAVGFGGPATVRRRAGETTLEFDTPSPVTVGFREQPSAPATVTVPETVEGVATAISQLTAGLATTGPERSHPAYRDHPPLVAFGERDIPAAVRERVPDTGIQFRVPNDIDHLLVAAPLAYYLGAQVVPVDGPPTLLAPGVDEPFSTLPAFAGEVAATLRRVFHLDCLVREGPTTVESALLDELGYDAETLRTAPLSERLRATLVAPALAIDDDLPEWPLSAYVEPRFDEVRSLPYLLDRMATVYPAEASELGARDLLEQTLDDFYRGEVATATKVDPELGVGRFHAWLADGSPIDAFKTSRRADENRLAAEPGDTLTVDVVCNDDAMARERVVADTYRERAAAFPVEVRVHERLPTHALARVFERPADFVHFIGHCEVEGLQCPDGHLSLSSLSRSRARTFFLNACGSYSEGETLIERGSVAGAVTFAKVLDSQAATVGTTFARLLAHGFGFEQALQLARRRIMMGKDYAVVGDGAYAPAAAFGDPAVLETEPVEEGYACTYDVTAAAGAGRTYRDPYTGRERLFGDAATATCHPHELAAFLDGRVLPVRHDGEFVWADELSRQLRSRR
ncbi:hypothetical protein [Natronomonas sp. EA1]|uniref:hypothetical protein n=1 Tax=Natronomonas sp. EA1 TaxID=3421655 RepID=UPI003EBE7296